MQGGAAPLVLRVQLEGGLGQQQAHHRRVPVLTGVVDWDGALQRPRVEVGMIIISRPRVEVGMIIIVWRWG